MPTLFAVLAILLLFSLTIFIHELGHFFMARLCGMKVDTFSIGFGPAVWKRERNGTVYKVGALPFGGYVALPQMDPSGTETGEEPSDTETPAPRPPPAPPWKRILVSVSGATGNILLAFFFAWVIFWVGKPSAPNERRCVIGYVERSSQAWEAGLRTGDSVISVEGTPVRNWQDLVTTLALCSKSEVSMVVGRPETDTHRTLSITTQQGNMGIRLPQGVAMEELCRVSALMKGGSAEAAGVQPGDLIVSFDGKPVYSRPHLIEQVEQHANQAVSLRVRREGQERVLTVQPTLDPETGRVLIGILFSPIAVDYDQVSHPRPTTQIREHALLIIRILRALITPRESRAAANALGGPVSIFYTYWMLVRDSFMMAIWFTVLLNVNLAVLNLLPIPVLDGGHIMFALFEGIFRRPVHPVAIAWAHRIFATLFILLFLFLTFRDTLRLFF